MARAFSRGPRGRKPQQAVHVQIAPIQLPNPPPHLKLQSLSQVDGSQGGAWQAPFAQLCPALHTFPH